MKFDLKTLITKFNSLSEKARYGTFIGLVLLVVGLDVFFLALPQWSAITKANEEMKTTSDDIQKVTTDKLRIKQIQGNIETQRKQLDAMNIKIRSLQEVPVILETISRIANQYNVKIDQLMPQKQEQENLTSVGKGNYYALPIVIQLRGGYHMFGHFLNKLEGEDLYFTIRDLTIQSNDKDPGSNLFAMTIKVILTDQPEMVSKNP